jgi:hypothetical protein
MATDLKEIIEQLRLERDILQAGGYGRSVRTPWKEERLFRDSITCLNVGEQVKRHPCNECLLYEWVPEQHKQEDIPCHFIPLNERGESIASLEDRGAREEAEKALLTWLNATIQRLEEKLAAQTAVGSKR